MKPWLASSLLGLFLLGSAVPQGVNEVCNLSLDLCFVVDASSSIKANDWDKVKSFINDAIQYFKIGDNNTLVSVVTFANAASFDIKFGAYTDKDSLVGAIGSLAQAGGATNTKAGLNTMWSQAFNINNGERSSASNVAIVITDGRHTDDYGDPYGEAAKAREMGIKILAVGIGEKIDKSELRNISSPDDQLANNTGVFFSPNFDSLKDLLVTLTTKTCIYPDYVTDCVNQADITFVLDTSGSIDQTKFDISKTFVQSIVRGLSIQADLARVAVITYSDNVMPQFLFRDHRSQDEVVKAIDKIPYKQGKTNTAAALEYLHKTLYTETNGDRKDAPNIAIILTDGGSSDRQKTLEEAYMCKKNSIHLIAIGLGDWTNQNELAGIASYPHERNKIDVEDYSALSSIKNRLEELICNKRNECDANNNPCKNGGQCIDGVDIFWCRCKFPWGGHTCDQACNKRADVIFALDASGSMGPKNFRIQLDFIQNVILGLNVGQETRVGLLTFGDDPSIRFHLYEYNTKLDVLNAMSVFYSGGSTNTAEAIRVIREEMFTVEKGDRVDVSNIAVIFTDGRSDDRPATWQEATLARREGIQMMAIGVGSGVRSIELEGIASAPVDQNVLNVVDFNALSSIEETLINATCNAGCSNFRCENGGTVIDSLRGCKCRCPIEFRGPRCEKRCSAKIDLALVIDASGSIRAERFPKVLQFIIDVLSDFALEDDGGAARVGAVSFSEDAKLNFNLGTYKTRQDVLLAVKQIEFVGKRTNSSAGLAMMQREIFNTGDDRNDADNIALMFTDGNSNVNEHMTIPNAISARVEGTHIIVFGVGDMINMLEIEGIASQPYSDTVHLVKSWTELPTIVEELKKATCDDRNECASNPCLNGGTCRDWYKRYWCNCPPQNTGVTCARRCSRSMDVALMLDISGSTEEVQNIILAFAIEVVYGLPLSLDRSRVAVIFYSDDAMVHFYLNTYQSKEGALNAMVLRSAGGKTNTQAAITTAYEKVFVPARGDRNGAQNIGIVVSDGKSNINRGNTLPAAEEAKRRGIELYSVAVGPTPDMAEINGMASDPNSDHVVRLRNVSEVAQAADNLLDTLCR